MNASAAPSAPPAISVIIPTYNRLDSARRTLDSLQQQTFDPRQFEVIVVSDGSRDGTVEALQSYAAPYTLRVIDQPNQGPSTARNHGAQQAAGRWLVFLDDDIGAAEGLIAAHAAAQQVQEQRVVIGYLPPMLGAQRGYFRAELRAWWEMMFDPLRKPAHRFRYSNLLTGNFSLPAALFQQLGGFNTTLWCHEDYEFGWRLIKTGANFTYAEAACGDHYENTDLDRSLRRKFQEGRADIQIAALHPELLPGLPLVFLASAEANAEATRRVRWLRRLAFAQPALGDALARYYRRTMDYWDATQRYWPWRTLLYDLLDYWYWRGVAKSLGSRQALAETLQRVVQPRGETPLELDLRAGLALAEQRLDAEHPQSMILRYGAALIGEFKTQPGEERLRGAHLRGILATDFCYRFMLALAGSQQPAQDAETADPLLKKFFFEAMGKPIPTEIL